MANGHNVNVLAKASNVAQADADASGGGFAVGINGAVATSTNTGSFSAGFLILSGMALAALALLRVLATVQQGWRLAWQVPKSKAEAASESGMLSQPRRS